MKQRSYRFLVNIIALFIAAQFLPLEANSPLHILGAGILLGFINLLIRPLLILLTLPLNILTLGLFTLIVNTWMIMLTSGLMPGFYVPGFWTAFMTGILVTLANWTIKNLLIEDKR